MLCEHCGKNPATHFYSQNINGQEQSLYLCSECASKHGSLFGFLDPLSPLSSLFASFPEFTPLIDSHTASAPAETVCPECGATAADIAKTGQVGCARCYQIFSNLLAPYLAKLYGKAVHTGRKPLSYKPSQPPVNSHNSVNEEINRLLRLQAEAIRQERFEDAARIRDEINRLRQDKGGNTL